MNIKKILSISFLFVVAGFFVNAALKEEKDALHKRNFNISIVEVKDGQPARKTVADELSFKDGKLFSGFLNTKYSYKWIRYRINRDSIYTDSTNTEVRLLELEAVTTDEANNTLMMFVKIVEWDIEGYIKMTKNDKLKKYYDFVGREKGGKPKKVKKKKKKEEAKPEVEVAPGEVRK